MAKWFVELEPGVYLAPGEGDPSRTLVQESAQEFGSYTRAYWGLKKARQHRPFRKARVALFLPTEKKDKEQ